MNEKPDLQEYIHKVDHPDSAQSQDYQNKAKNLKNKELLKELEIIPNLEEKIRSLQNQKEVLQTYTKHVTTNVKDLQKKLTRQRSNSYIEGLKTQIKEISENMLEANRTIADDNMQILSLNKKIKRMVKLFKNRGIDIEKILR